MDGSTLLKTYFLDVENKRDRGVEWIPTRNVMILTKLLKAFTVHQNWFESGLHFTAVTFLKSENYRPWIQCKKLKLLLLYSLHVIHTSWHLGCLKLQNMYFCVLHELFQIMHKSIQKLHLLNVTPCAYIGAKLKITMRKIHF